ncbi:MAG: T9SS type A sorting domain-containing protein [Bacteroidota bacterium]
MLQRLIQITISAMILLATTVSAQPTYSTFSANGFVLRQRVKINPPQEGQITYAWNPGSSEDIGRRDDATYETRFRMRTALWLPGIPTNARIDTVKLTLTLSGWTSGTSKAAIVKLPATYANDAAAWSQFDSPLAVYFTNLQYDQTSNKDLKNPTFTADVTSVIRSGDPALTIGIMGLNEGTNNTDAYLFASVTVYWTPAITVTVQNSFSGGKVDIDGTLKDSPWTSGQSGQPSWYSGDSHNIRAYTQKIGAVTFPFPEPGSWISTCGLNRTQTNNNTPVAIAPTSACTFAAQFGQATAQVIVDQKLNTNASVDSVGRWQGGPDFVMYAVPDTFTFNVPSSQVLRGVQNILSGEKYNKWIKAEADEPDVINHHTFSVDQAFPDKLRSQLRPTTQGVTIRSESVQSGIGGVVEFKDPWLVDYPDASYNNKLRNQGMNAPFKSRTSPFSPDLSTNYAGDVYKGVFLNENSTFDSQLPIHSIRAPFIQTINGSTGIFQGWIYNPDYTAIQQMGSNPNGYDQKAVVFKQAGDTIKARYSSTVTTSVTVPPGTYSISSNLTVAYGATLTLSPGTTLNFTGPYKLRIEGALIAHGTLQQRITFTRSGGQWYGIEFYYNYGSGSSIQYAIIENAQYGVADYGTSPYLANNKIRYNYAGVYVSGSIPSMNWNLFEYNTYGVHCVNYGDANMQTNNVIRYNSHGVRGDYSSVPAVGSYIGYNGLYNDYYDINSDYGGTIYARGNWWGQYPASPSLTMNVDYSGELSVDPNSWAVGFAVSPDKPTSELSLGKSSLVQSDTAGMSALDQAYRQYLDEDFENAMTVFESIVERHSNSFAGTRALAFAVRIRDKLGRDSKAALDQTANAASESKVRALAKSLLVGRLIREGLNDQALNLAIDLCNHPDPLIAKMAMFDAASIAWYKLDDKAKGTEYFERLIAAHPEQPESFSAQATLGTWEPKPTVRGTETAKVSIGTELSLQSYPNPFNPATEIRFAIPEEGLVTLRIYDVLGRVVTTLVNENRQAGPHSVRWDASQVPSGVYFSRLETQFGSVVSRLLLVR